MESLGARTYYSIRRHFVRLRNARILIHTSTAESERQIRFSEKRKNKQETVKPACADLGTFPGWKHKDLV